MANYNVLPTEQVQQVLLLVPLCYFTPFYLCSEEFESNFFCKTAYFNQFFNKMVRILHRHPPLTGQEIFRSLCPFLPFN